MPEVAIQLPQTVKIWVQKQLGYATRIVELLSGGKNNQTFLVKTATEKFVLKVYFIDDAQRFRREIEFVDLMQSFDVAGLPSLVAQSEELGIALFEYIPGAIPDSVDSSMVKTTARWLRSINRIQIHCQAQHILSARGGLPDVSEFFKDIEKRQEAFRTVSVDDYSSSECQKLVFESMTKVLEQLNRQRHLSGADNWQLARCLSPSDIGFHNSLLVKPEYTSNAVQTAVSTGSAKQLVFLDFEYAGWDSCAKLLCDFFAQPRFNVDRSQVTEFMTTAFAFVDTEQLLEQCKLLLPVSHLKWALIFLNDFKHSDQQRRNFAISDYDAQQQKCIQLEKARNRVAIAEQLVSEMA